MTDRQCPSCGGFCRKSGCERENVEPELTPAELRCGIALQLREIERLQERVKLLEEAVQHYESALRDAWDSTTHQKNGDGRLWQCMEELRGECAP